MDVFGRSILISAGLRSMYPAPEIRQMQFIILKSVTELFSSLPVLMEIGKVESEFCIFLTRLNMFRCTLSNTQLFIFTFSLCTNARPDYKNSPA